MAVSNLGATYLFLRKPGTAESFLKIALEGNDVKAYGNYALALAELGLVKEFNEFVKKAAKKFPEDELLGKMHLVFPEK